MTEHRSAYRPARPAIDPTEYTVAPIAEAVAKSYVVAHHYSGSYPAARRRYGLFRGADLVGVAVYSVPVNYRTFACLPGAPDEHVELGRLVLQDDVAANGESWFVARTFAALRAQGFRGVVSFSDPMPRTTAAGDVVFGGHVGTIYQALNGVYLGRSSPGTLMLLPDGSTLHRRAITKLRTETRGWRYVEAMLLRHGAPARERESLAEYADRCVRTVARRVRHPGNHKYAWTLQRRDRKHLPATLPYPKTPDTAALFARLENRSTIFK